MQRPEFTNIITDISHLGLLCIAGVDAQKFLQGQLTCDLTEVGETYTHLGAHCNPQGRIVSLFRIFCSEQRYFLQMPYELLPIALEALKKYAVFFKVSLTNVSHQYKQIGYREKMFNTIFLTAPDNNEDTLNLYLKKFSLQATIAPRSAWKRLDIMQGIPQIYPETSAKFLPHEINLPKLNAVSFKKGCYTGQEIIARMEYLGKSKKHLYRTHFETASPPLRGSDIFDEKGTCGTIVDYCQIEDSVYELLVILPDTLLASKLLFIDPHSPDTTKITLLEQVKT